jgi:hypothetical protein
MFDENSGLVNVWVRLIKDGKRTLAEVPNISNLKTIVEGIITQ